MELRNEDKKEGSTMKLSGEEAEELQKKQGISELEAWDFSKDIEPIQITSAKSKLNREAKENKEISAGGVILKTFQVIIWLVIVAEIVTFASICMRDNSLILYHLKDAKWMFIAGAVILFIDALLVSIIGQTNPLLFVTALILPFLYPAIRGSQTDGGNTIGRVISVLYFLSICCFLGVLLNSYMFYGSILFLEDRSEQQVIIRAYDQTMETGKTLGEIFKGELDITDTKVDTLQNGNVVITFSGNGNLYLIDDGFAYSLNNSVPTVLVFTEQGNHQFALTEASLKGTELTQTGVTNYWKRLTKQEK